jgi:DNA-binding XRE family transcriptional regulator
VNILKLSPEKINMYLAEKNILKKELAELSGISRQTIISVTSGKSCSTTTAGKIAKALEIPVKEIMED